MLSREEILIPARFACTVAHLVMVLTAAYDVAGAVVRAEPTSTTASRLGDLEVRVLVPHAPCCERAQPGCCLTPARLFRLPPAPKNKPSHRGTHRRAAGTPAALRILRAGHLAVLLDIGRRQRQGWLRSMTGASFALFALEFAGIFGGVSLFLPKVNTLSTLLHFFGFVFTALYLGAAWDVKSFAWIFSFCSVLPALAEALAAFAVFKLKIVQWG